MGNVHPKVRGAYLQRRKRRQLKLIQDGFMDAGEKAVLYAVRREIIRKLFMFAYGSPVLNYYYEHRFVRILMENVSIPGRIEHFWILHCMAPNLQGLIYIMDTTNTFRLANIRKEIIIIMESSEHLIAAPLLVYAIKLDLPDAMTIEEVTVAMTFDEIPLRPSKHTLKVIQLCIRDGEGYQEGFKWLLRKLRPRILESICNAEKNLGPNQPRSACNF